MFDLTPLQPIFYGEINLLVYWPPGTGVNKLTVTQLKPIRLHKLSIDGDSPMRNMYDIYHILRENIQIKCVKITS